MNCLDLAATGAAPLALVVAAAVCLALGLVLVLAMRRRRRASVARIAGTLALVAVLVLAGATVAHVPQASAASSAGCSSNDGGYSLVVSQLSVNAGMGPFVEPSAITGTVSNGGAERTYISRIVVSIASVIHADDAVAGPCDADDYALAGQTIQVDKALDPGASLEFGGATIGFLTTDRNQDACQGATVDLMYTVVAEDANGR